MDEPMEEVNGRNELHIPDKIPNGILPGSSMVMINMCKEDYEVHYWPKLESSIQQLLTLSPGEYVPISYEQMYSCVYKCVCKQFSERLYSDLLMYVENHLRSVATELNAVDSSVYIVKFNATLNQYEQALAGIVPIFNYMNRFYVENKLHTDLRTQLLKSFTTIVAENHIAKLIPILLEAHLKPFSVLPPVMASVIKGLYNLKPAFAQLSPPLFAKFIPNLLAPMDESDLPQYVAETQEIQQQLLEGGFPRGDQSRKRRSEVDTKEETESHSAATNQNVMNQNAEVALVQISTI